MTQTILAAILLLMPAPSPKWEETHDAFRIRMELTARAIDKASEAVDAPHRRHLAMALTVIFWGESRFSPLVQSGERRGDMGRSICFGQNQKGRLTHEEWLSLAGTDLESTTRCATVSATRLVSHWRHCKSLDPRFSWPEAMVLYGTGRTCRAHETNPEHKNIFLDRGAKWTRLIRT